jgi:hypothetical protein
VRQILAIARGKEACQSRNSELVDRRVFSPNRPDFEEIIPRNRSDLAFYLR